MKSFLMYCLAGLVGAVIYGQLSDAHPCEAEYEVCGYEMEVDPQTGKLEQVYVCH